MSETHQMTQKQQIRVAALQQAAPLAMLLAQTTGQIPTAERIFQMADKVGVYITSGMVTP